MNDVCNTDVSVKELASHTKHVTEEILERIPNNIQNDQKNYSTLQSTFKDCTKICEGRPALWNILKEHMQRAHVELISAYKNDENNDKDSCINGTTRLVSSNLPIEKCAKRSRYKSAWEKK